MANKIKIAISGIGNRALPKDPKGSNWLGWVELIRRSGKFELSAAHDVSESSIKRLVEGGYLGAGKTFLSLDDMLSSVELDAMLVCNPAEYHAVTIKKALDHDLDILVEKPLVNELDAGFELVRYAEKKKRVMAVVQNWRTKDTARLMREAIAKGAIGTVGQVFFRYIRNRENPRYPSYIFDEKLPLLYAMGIHHLDLFRYILNDEYVSVSGNSFKPAWSLYRFDTGLDLFLKTSRGVNVLYSGTVSSKSNGFIQESFVVEGDSGTLYNESQWSEPPLWYYQAGSKERVNIAEKVGDPSVRGQYDISDSAILDNFYAAIREGSPLICSAADGLGSVRALEAARMACQTGKTISMESI